MVVVLLFFFKMMNGNTSALSFAKLNAQTDTAYAGDATKLATGILGAFGGGGDDDSSGDDY